MADTELCTRVLTSQQRARRTSRLPLVCPLRERRCPASWHFTRVPLLTSFDHDIDHPTVCQPKPEALPFCWSLVKWKEVKSKERTHRRNDSTCLVLVNKGHALDLAGGETSDHFTAVRLSATGRTQRLLCHTLSISSCNVWQ